MAVLVSIATTPTSTAMKATIHGLRGPRWSSSAPSRGAVQAAAKPAYLEQFATSACPATPSPTTDRKRVVEGKGVPVRVDRGARRLINKKKSTQTNTHTLDTKN